VTKSCLYLISFLFISSASFAQEVEMVSSFHRGEGCFTENTQVSLGSDSIAMNFQSFNATLDPYISASASVKSCKWTGTFRVPQGYAIVMRGGEFKGYSSLHEETTSAVHSEISLDGQNSDASSFMLKRNDSQKFIHNSSKYVRSMHGKCGGTSVIQMNATMFVRSKSDSRIYISSVELKELVIPFALVKCSP
jgi:hypothetical protein